MLPFRKLIKGGELTEQEIRTFIGSYRWTFAKTMASTPHEYLVRGKTVPDAPFVRFAAHIRAAGYRTRFGGRIYTYFDLDGYHYWTMGNPMPETTILNRAKIT